MLHSGDVTCACSIHDDINQSHQQSLNVKFSHCWCRPPERSTQSTLGVRAHPQQSIFKEKKGKKRDTVSDQFPLAYRARAELARLFGKVIQARRADPQRNAQEADLLASFITSRYSPSVNGGRLLIEEEITGMLIAVLFAGQHTSSITSTWTGLFMMSHPVSQRGWLFSSPPPQHMMRCLRLND